VEFTCEDEKKKYERDIVNIGLAIKRVDNFTKIIDDLYKQSDTISNL